MADYRIRPYAGSDEARVVELSLDAWASVFNSFRAVFGDRLYERIHPDWRADQAASVRSALVTHTTGWPTRAIESSGS